MTPQRIKRQILEAIMSLQRDDDPSMIADTQVAEKTEIDLEIVRDYMELLVADGDLVDGTDSGGHAGALTAQGRRTLSEKPQRESTTDNRMTHDEIRRLILQTIHGNQSNSGITVQDSLIAAKTGLSIQEVQDHLEVLEEEGKVDLARNTAGHGAWLTARGRLGLQEKPKEGPAMITRTTSADALQHMILTAINEGQGQNVTDSDIAMNTGLELQVVRDYLSLLKDEDMVTVSKPALADGSRAARLQPRGRLALREGAKTPAQMKRRTILILAANPKDTHQLRLDEECRRIEEAMERSRRRDEFDVVSKWAVTDDDLRRALLRHEPEIVHFSGHGSQFGLEFEDDLGLSLPVSGTALAGLFKLCIGHVRCVVLNACFSQFQAESIAEHIEFVVGMGARIGDQAAIKFAQGFYDGIGHGRGFEDAFNLGRNAIDLRGIPEYQTPILLKRTDIQRQANRAAQAAQGEQLDALYEVVATQAEQSRSRDTWSPVDIENIRSQVWANVNNLGESTAVCPIDGFPVKITLQTDEFLDADISAYCARHGLRSIEKATDPMRPSFDGKDWAEHHIKGMAEMSLRGFMVNCPICGSVVRSKQDPAWVLLNCLRCGRHAEVPVR